MDQAVGTELVFVLAYDRLTSFFSGGGVFSGQAAGLHIMQENNCILSDSVVHLTTV
jgi:hypothetical protein